MFDDGRGRLPAVWRDPGSDGYQVGGDFVPSMPNFRSAELMEPARAATVESDFTVPALQSAFGGLLVGLMAALWGAHWQNALTWGLAALIVVWVLVLGHSRRLLVRIKRIIGPEAVRSMAADVQTVKHEHIVKIDQGDGRAHERIMLNLGMDDAQLLTFARGVLNGKMTVSSWSGPGGELSRGQFEAARDELIRAGFASWKSSDHKGGWALSVAGRSWFRRLAAGAG